MQISRPTSAKINKQKTKDDTTKTVSWRSNNLNFVNNLSQSQKEILNERLSRIKSNPNQIKDLITIIGQSSSTYEVYSKYHKEYENDEDLVAMQIMSQEEVELFAYIEKHNLQNDIVQTSTLDIDKQLLEDSSKEFQKFLIENPQYSVSEKISDTNQVKLPHIYILGDKQDFALINAMSLNTQVKLMNTIKILDEFENDVDSKIVIISQNPNVLLSDKYNEIFNKQSFRTFLSFKSDSDKDGTKTIFPLTRENLIMKII